jgi:hypothetical protein
MTYDSGIYSMTVSINLIDFLINSYEDLKQSRLLSLIYYSYVQGSRGTAEAPENFKQTFTSD